ncbi:hypothetical protein ATANTOWER_024037 [Ataeniobius toweri]|uniref:Secreted protein n=1 Tax=Ataeniobius toweri TaxID=208326 RepID=A0ABU7AHP3_9TELE|nr:hypothetical protein [Ataeniobius toweri]
MNRLQSPIQILFLVLIRRGSVDEPPSHPLSVREGFGDGLPPLPVPVSEERCLCKQCLMFVDYHKLNIACICSQYVCITLVLSPKEIVPSRLLRQGSGMISRSHYVP